MTQHSYSVMSNREYDAYYFIDLMRQIFPATLQLLLGAPIIGGGSCLNH